MKPPEYPQGHTHKIDQLREIKSDMTIHETKSRHNEICSITNRGELGVILKELFPLNGQKMLREFFNNHPVCWFDLLRKLHTYRRNDKEAGGWYIETEHIGDIYSSFLTRGRHSDNTIGGKLRSILPDAISKNQNLLSYASNQPSLLDDSGHSFSQIPEMQRKNSIGKFINFGMMKNIGGCEYSNIDAYFTRIFPKILHYLAEIFGMSTSLSYCTSVEQLITKLNKMFSSGSGEERETAFRIIQAFHAWSGIEDIEHHRNQAEGCIAEIATVLHNMGLPVSNIRHSEHNDATIYSGTISHNGDIYRIEWRVKTVKSILQKMWETEEYTNIDAIRDTIGISVIYPDDTEDDSKIDIITKFGSLMSDFGYLLKDKGGLGDKIQEVEEKMKSKKKHPVHTTRKRGEATNEKLKNTSLSGYMHIGLTVAGVEVQFSSASSAESKKKDDKKYKSRSALSTLMRGEKFATPRRCFMLLNKRVDAESMGELGYSNINAMLMGMIDDGFLRPYVSNDGETLLFTCNGKEKYFKAEFPTMKPCTPNTPFYEKMKDFIQSLRSTTI